MNRRRFLGAIVAAPVIAMAAVATQPEPASAYVSAEVGTTEVTVTSWIEIPTGNAGEMLAFPVDALLDPAMAQEAVDAIRALDNPSLELQMLAEDLSTVARV